MSAVIVPIVPKIELDRVLFTTDFTEASCKALPLVSAIARRYGANVYTAHVWTPGPYPLVAPEVVAVLDRQTEKGARWELEKLLKSKPLDGMKAEPLLSRGKPAHEIARLVDHHNISLVVMSTHGRTGFKHRVLGSVAEEVVRTSRCPVLTVGPRLAERFGRVESMKAILFPTDFSIESLAVFPYLASLAHEYQSRITILHVLPPETAGRPEATNQAERLREQMKRALANEISPRCVADYVIDSGDPGEIILAHARRMNADLIGLGVRGATDIARHFHETVAYRILAEAECPVLTRHTAR
jgi:nucleotide-binding universal stress UspA family protein